ncbi:MAG: Gfo/Idh/MocA family oxidoreductase [Candidatus Aureabacteria bacterium]|nr:Gfo/Idh/MocA family oxidoreductase [Candidatus Auribacterota bacterium]
MEKTLRWGILGAARICRRVIPAINAAGRSRVVAVASRDPRRGQEFASRWEIPRSFDSYEALLDSPEIEVVYVPLPNHLHCEWTVRAVEAGKQVLCEKPLALSTAEVDRVIAAARNKKAQVLEALAYRAHPQFAKLLEIARKGEIGKVKLIRARYCFTLGAGPGNIRWRKEMGGGALWDVGGYPVSFARAIVGEAPEEVFAYLAPGATGVDVLGAGQLKYRSGVLAQIECGYCLAYGVGTEVVGENGTIALLNPWQPDVDGKRNGLLVIAPDDQAYPVGFPPIDPYLCEVRALEDAVLDGKPLPWTLQESRDNVAALAALHRSAASGAPVRLDADMGPRS